MHFSSLIPQMSIFTLSSFVWLLPICLDLWTYHSRLLWNVVLYCIGLYFHHQTHLQISNLSALAQSFSFPLELFLCSYQGVYWTPTDLGSSSFNVISFCFCVLLLGLSRKECWSGLPFISPGDHFCQYSPPRSVCFGWPFKAWLIITLS